jgi:chemotaxis protein CheZ
MVPCPTEPAEATPVANQADQIQQAICTTLRGDLAELRSFIDRRIAELSAEVSASVQLMDFSESNLSGQLNTIREQITGITALPSSATRNSGLELEAVVEATDHAANRIMEAAEAIGDWSRQITAEPAVIDVLNTHINTIFEACAFQDLTGQRIRRAIQHLQHVETMLTEVMPNGSSDPTEPPVPQVVVSAPLVRPMQTAEQASNDPDLQQASIDSLFD